jgi:hypothetical protein
MHNLHPPHRHPKHLSMLSRWSSLPLLVLFNLLFDLFISLALLQPAQSVAADAVAAASSGTQASIPVGNSEIRQWYNDQVATIATLDQQWQQQGLSVAQRAHRAYDIRHDARLKAREFMRDKSEVALLQARDKEKYGNPDGPTFDWLMEQSRKKGMSDNDAYLAIIGSSERTNAEVNKAFGSGKK